MRNGEHLKGWSVLGGGHPKGGVCRDGALAARQSGARSRRVDRIAEWLWREVAEWAGTERPEDDVTVLAIRAR